MIKLVCTSMVLVVLACSDERGEAPPPALVSVEFADELHVGGQQFTRITSLAFAPSGDLVVMDADEHTVTVLNRAGEEVSRWGGKGDGPGEFSYTLGSLAVSSQGVVAVDNARRVDLFTLAGKLVGTHQSPGSVFGLAFDRGGTVLARTRPMGASASDGELTEQIVRLSDGGVLWTSEPLPSIGLVQVFPPRAVLADLGGGLIAVGVSDRYDLAVLNAATGRKVGRVSRDVPIRGPSDEYITEYRESMIGLDDEAVPEEFIKSLTFAEAFPVIGRVFTGPPGRTVWVSRRGGVGDSLAAEAGDREAPLLYDLFTPGAYQYLGTVAVPDRIRLMTGDSTRVAGVQVDALGVPSVRVMRVRLEDEMRER